MCFNKGVFGVTLGWVGGDLVGMIDNTARSSRDSKGFPGIGTQGMGALCAWLGSVNHIILQGDSFGATLTRIGTDVFHLNSRQCVVERSGGAGPDGTSESSKTTGKGLGHRVEDSDTFKCQQKGGALLSHIQIFRFAGILCARLHAADIWEEGHGVRMCGEVEWCTSASR